MRAPWRPGSTFARKTRRDRRRSALGWAGFRWRLELAASRIHVLGVDQILERLDDSFGLLGSGSRGVPARQQTLRATLDWSHQLLTPAEQLVFRRLAVFAGGCELEAAEAVCSAEDASSS